MDLIDEVPLGGKKLGDILTKNEIKKPSSGLSKLLGQPAAGYPNDQTLHNEFLRLEREKNENLTQAICNIQNKLEKITAPKEVSEKKILNLSNIIPCATLLVGLLIGAGLFSQSEPIKTVEEVKKQEVRPAPAPKIAKPPTYVTVKFANMRKEASPEGALLKTITPNQVLETLEQKGGWFKVKYSDLVEEKTYTGWIWYELMKKIEEKK